VRHQELQDARGFTTTTLIRLAQRRQNVNLPLDGLMIGKWKYRKEELKI